MTATRERFERYHRENPEVYELFKQFTFEAIKAGHKHIGPNIIFARIRWETSIRTTGSRYKVDEKYLPWYSRMFMADHPEYDGFFRTRRIRTP